MGRRFLIIAVTLALSLGTVASTDPALQELEKRAAAAPMGERPVLYLDIAGRLLKSADELYTAGQEDEARAAVGNLVTYSGKAHDAAVQSGKRLKNTEIGLRKMSIRLRDLKRTLNFEDQAPVETAAEQLQKLSDDLLAHMFGKGK